MTLKPFPKVRGVIKLLDTTFPTVVHYLGIVCMFYAIFIDKGENPALIPAATGMILFKAIYGSGDRE